MLNNDGFDLWAHGYDKTVALSEKNNEYPFAGYKAMLNAIFNGIMSKQQAAVLDIGIGTGVLAQKLYERGHTITGIDFSQNMLALCAEKMPQAQLIQADLTTGIPQQLQQTRYDFIIATYSLHHLDEQQKHLFLQQLIPLLNESGKIFIGDISFQTIEHLNACYEKNKHHWDSDEFYFVADTFIAQLAPVFTVDYEPFSECGGIFTLQVK